MNERIDVLAVMDRLIGNTRTMAGLTGDPTMREHLREGEEASAAVAELIEAANKAKAALLTGQVGHINADDVGVYHLDGITCGNALRALRPALARVGAP